MAFGCVELLELVNICNSCGGNEGSIDQTYIHNYVFSIQRHMNYEKMYIGGDKPEPCNIYFSSYFPGCMVLINVKLNWIRKQHKRILR